MGRNTFQPNLINWSYLNLGTIAFTIENIKNMINTFNINQKMPSGITGIGDNHPPQKSIDTLLKLF